MSRLAAVLLAGAAACAHDRAFDRRDVGEMKNASPAISPWPGLEVDPVAADQADAGVEAVVDRVHETAVQVFAASRRGKVNVASGVLAGGGLVLTDLRALLVDSQPPAQIVVLTTKGPVPARIAGGAIDAGVAVLELPEAARALEGPPLAEGPTADQLIAVRASKQETSVVFEVIGFSLKPSQDALGLRTMPGLPAGFTGAPVFDSGGELAGLLVGPSEHEVVLVPSARLLEILGQVRPRAAQADQHI